MGALWSYSLIDELNPQHAFNFLKNTWIFWCWLPIPIASKNLYGICGITMSLKDYSEFSIIYQILVEEKGWLCPKSDGQEAMYAKNKAISSFRMTVVPKEQKQNVIDKWNSDVGTKNMND